MSSLQDFALDEAAYVELLRKLISVSELQPFVGEALSVERVEFVQGRGNVIIKYAPPSAAADKTLALVGSHMDVVPANPEGWQRNPFSLTVEGDKLFGRGTTDCLGHVALLTCRWSSEVERVEAGVDMLVACSVVLFRELAKHKVPTKTQVVCVLIASEENSEIEGVGVETLMESGKIDFIKNGPVFWVDCSDSQPCIGTAGAITWTLKATGKLFHSGLPNLGINGLELAMDAMTKIQEYFYKEFGPVEKEKEYNYSCPSTMKPTRIESSVNGLNQMYVRGVTLLFVVRLIDEWGTLCCSPPWAKIAGDVRLSPFYDMKEVRHDTCKVLIGTMSLTFLLRCTDDR
ncbi:unnamed protein product [Phytophthora lilii]|uniref:Unnamed protein product n=1 Tax=Phytophthora lilii TaxID=2077276 RepID=A0A9W7CH83_9STRA|nr:unnamed protein product [Phytophthora lilii]